jgi:hypothetical protein
VLFYSEPEGDDMDGSDAPSQASATSRTKNYLPFGINTNFNKPDDATIAQALRIYEALRTQAPELRAFRVSRVSGSNVDKAVGRLVCEAGYCWS